MQLKNLVPNLFEKIGDAFASDQQKSIKLLKQQGYSSVANCTRFEPSAMMNPPYPGFRIPVCNYEMLEKDEDILVVGDIKSVYYGDKKFSGEPGTLEKNCFYNDERCGLKSISNKPGEVIPTKDLLKQLRCMGDDSDGTTATRIVDIPRDTVRLALTEMGFNKIKGSNQYVRGDISIFPSRNGTGTEILYMGSEVHVEKFYEELQKYKH